MKKISVNKFDVNDVNFEKQVADFYNRFYKEGVPTCYFSFETHSIGHYLVIIANEYNRS